MLWFYYLEATDLISARSVCLPRTGKRNTHYLRRKSKVNRLCTSLSEEVFDDQRHHSEHLSTAQSMASSAKGCFSLTQRQSPLNDVKMQALPVVVCEAGS